MQLYTMIAYHSRWLDRDFDKNVPCEWCEYKYTNYKKFKAYEVPKQRRNIKRANDVDHIFGRWGWEKRNIWNRMYDPKNLIFLCRTCHQMKGWIDMTKVFQEIVLSKLVHKTYEDCVATNKTIEREWMSKVKAF